MEDSTNFGMVGRPMSADGEKVSDWTYEVSHNRTIKSVIVVLCV